MDENNQELARLPWQVVGQVFRIFPGKLTPLHACRLYCRCLPELKDMERTAASREAAACRRRREFPPAAVNFGSTEVGSRFLLVGLS